MSRKWHRPFTKGKCAAARKKNVIAASQKEKKSRKTSGTREVRNRKLQTLGSVTRVSAKYFAQYLKFGKMHRLESWRSVFFINLLWHHNFLTLGAYHLARKSRNFGLKSNAKVIFQKLRSEIVQYLQRYSSFSVRNGAAEISLPFAKLSSFQSLISRKQLREIELQMVSAILFG